MEKGKTRMSVDVGFKMMVFGESCHALFLLSMSLQCSETEQLKPTRFPQACCYSNILTFIAKTVIQRSESSVGWASAHSSQSLLPQNWCILLNGLWFGLSHKIARTVQWPFSILFAKGCGEFYFCSYGEYFHLHPCLFGSNLYSLWQETSPPPSGDKKNKTFVTALLKIKHCNRQITDQKFVGIIKPLGVFR